MGNNQLNEALITSVNTVIYTKANENSLFAKLRGVKRCRKYLSLCFKVKA